MKENSETASGGGFRTAWLCSIVFEEGASAFFGSSFFTFIGAAIIPPALKTLQTERFYVALSHECGPF